MKRHLSCLCLACALSIGSAQVDTNRIIPGKQLGKLKIGDLMEDMKWLKKPDFGDTSSGRQWQTWEAKKPDPRNGKIINSLDVYSAVNTDGKYQIRMIRATSPTFATSGKIKVGSAYQDVTNQFSRLAKVGEYKSPQFSEKVALFDDATGGISFEFKPGADGTIGLHSKCLSIWVHDPGMKVLQDFYSPIQYLTSKPSLKKASK